jgi:glycosyltransferase involved in cell wall biosynthesis
MRILHVTTFLQGGAGRIITALAVAQQRAGHDVVVVADSGHHTGYESYPEYIARLREAGVPFHTVTSTFTRDVALNVRAVEELTALLGGRAADVAHSHAAIPTLVARLALSPHGYTPLLQTMHGWGIRKTAEQAATDITLLGLADAVVTPSAAARDTLLTLGLRAGPVHVVPYGLDDRPARQTPDAGDAELFERLRASGCSIVLCVGTIGERKNQALLVRALASLDRVAAVFIGDGDAAPLTALARELGVGPRAHVLGYRADASRYLALADALALPSMNEGLPLVVLEAFRAGVPVVGSCIPEIAEAVDEGRTGFLFAPGDASGLTAALAQALAPAARAAMRRHARQVFESRYRDDRMLAAYRQLYAELCARHQTCNTHQRHVQ